MKQFLFVLFCLVSGLVTAQEINCTNGIDDDGDGKIDCADGDCFSEAHCPIAFDQTPAICEDSFGSGNASVDLTTYEFSITGGVSHTVSWYRDTSAVGNPIIPITTPTVHTVANNDVVFAEVDNGTNQKIASVTFTVNSLPIVIDQTPSVCEDVSGSGQSTVNLTTLEAFIDGGSGYTFSWYHDAALTIPLADPSNTTVNNGQSFFSLADNGNCVDTATVTYTVNSLDDPSFTYANTTYCPTDLDPVATITGDAGGTFSAPAGLVINSSTGKIDLSASDVGNHTITYTTAGTCPNSSTFGVDILDNSEPTAQLATGVTCDAFTATWDATFGATGYEVDVAEDPYFTTMVAGYSAVSTTNTFLNVTGLTATQTYYYQVRAITSCGTSLNSDTISVEVLDTPGSTASLTASDPTCDGFNVSWDAVTYASGYLLEVSKDGFATTDISQSLPSTSLAIAGLDQGTVYEYRVTPQNVCGSGPVNAGVYQTNDVPPAPVNLTASNVICDGADLSWDPVVDADDYLVEIDDDPTFASVDDSQTVTLFDYTASGLITSTQYFYRVTPGNSCGAGSVSSVGTFTTDSLPSSPVDTLLLVEHNQANVAWEGIINADTYSVEVATDDLFSSIMSTNTLDSTLTEVTGLIPLTTYYLRIFADNTCGSGPFSDTLIFTTPQDPLIIDSLALVDLYNATDGTNWTDNTNWLSGNISTWQGVVVTNNRVAKLELSNNQLTGSFPASMSDLTGLKYANIRDNALTGTLSDWISNYSETTDSLLLSGNQFDAIASSVASTSGAIELSNNALTFEDLLPVLGSLPNLIYAPQAKVGSTTNTFRNVEDSYTLSLNIDASLTDNQYVWFRDGVAIDTTTVGEYVMDTIIISDGGVYICEVTNPAAPNLTLVSNPMTVNVQAKSNSLIFTEIADVNYGASPFVLNASASSGLPVLFKITEGDSLVDIQGDIVTALGIGQVTIRATQPGDDFYEASNSVTREFTITQGTQTIAFTAISDQDIFLSDSISLAISASSGLPIDFTIDGPAELDDSILYLLDTGTVTLTASQAGNELYQPAFPVSQSFVVFTSDTVPPTTEPPVDSTVNYSVSVQLATMANPPSVTASLHQASGSTFSMKQEKSLTSGSGSFSDVPGGYYSVRFTNADGSYFPTYLGGRLTLAQANIFGLVQDTTLTISFISKPDTTLQSGVVVGGVLTEEPSSGGRISESLTLASIPVYLVRISDQSVVGYGSTDNNGRFYFPNVPPDDYYFLADHEGVDLRNNQIAVADKSLKLSVVVDKFITVTNIEEGATVPLPTLVTGLDRDYVTKVAAYPNPAVDWLMLEIPTDWMGNQMIVTNAAGQQVVNQVLIAEKNRVSLQSLPAGLYYAQIKNKQSSHFIKIIKQ